MADNDRGWLARSVRSLQENVHRSGPAASAAYALVGSVLLLGGLGYLLDVWLSTTPWLAGAGLALGVIVGFYQLVKTTMGRG